MPSSEIIYTYDGTLEGLLSAVFHAFSEKEAPVDIKRSDGIQYSMLASYIPVMEDDAYALRVKRGIEDKLGANVWNDVRRVFLSDEADKEICILHYLQYMFKDAGRAKNGAEIDTEARAPQVGHKPRRKSPWTDILQSSGAVANPAVSRMEEILRQVSNECEKARQFIRFAELHNGLYFARFSPKANVIPIVMPHFVARFNVQPFVIYDPVHDIAGVYDMSDWWLVDTSLMDVGQGDMTDDYTKREDDVETLWQAFFKSVSIKQRYNPECQRNFMPKRFWADLVEMRPRYDKRTGLGTGSGTRQEPKQEPRLEP